MRERRRRVIGGLGYFGACVAVLCSLLEITAPILGVIPFVIGLLLFFRSNRQIALVVLAIWIGCTALAIIATGTS